MHIRPTIAKATASGRNALVRQKEPETELEEDRAHGMPEKRSTEYSG